MTELVKYYKTLLETPTLPDSLALLTHDTVVYRYWKWATRRCFGQRTELERALESQPLSLAVWRVERTARWSRQLEEERNLLFEPVNNAEEGYIHSLARAFAIKKSISPQTQTFFTLLAHIETLRSLSAFSQYIKARCLQPLDPEDASHQQKLRTLWRLCKPDEPLDKLVTKRWQEIGFQGTSPFTDFRSTGRVGLDHLLYLAQSSPSECRSLIEESVEGGDGWYPLAIVSIAMSDFLINSLKDGTLTLYLLLATENRRANSFESSEDTLLAANTNDTGLDALSDVLSELHRTLLYGFHDHWMYLSVSDKVADQDRPTVMKFEQVFKRWRTELVRWLIRGRLAGWFDNRGFIRLSTDKPPTSASSANDRKTRIIDEEPLIVL